MKLLKYAFLIILASIFIYACNNDDDDSTPVAPNNTVKEDSTKNSQPYFRVNLDGQPTNFFPFGSIDSNLIVVGGLTMGSDFPQLLIILNDTLKPDTYHFSTPATTFFYYNLSQDSSLFQTEGTIILETLDLENRKAKGTFEGKLKGFLNNSKDSIMVTEGEFYSTF